MNNKLIALIVIIILIIAGYLFWRNSGEIPMDMNVDSENTSGTSDNETAPTGTSPTGTGAEVNIGATTTIVSPAVKEFTVDVSNFRFSPATMTVNRGDTVKITLKNMAGTHDLKIDEFNAGTRILQAGQQETITFVANKSGSFEYYCSVGSHRSMGMVGTLTVR